MLPNRPFLRANSMLRQTTAESRPKQKRASLVADRESAGTTSAGPDAGPRSRLRRAGGPDLPRLTTTELSVALGQLSQLDDPRGRCSKPVRATHTPYRGIVLCGAIRTCDRRVSIGRPSSAHAGERPVHGYYLTVAVKQSLWRMEPSFPSRRHCTSKRTPSTKGAPREISKCSAPAPPFDVVRSARSAAAA